MQTMTDSSLKAAIHRTTDKRDINDPSTPGLQLRVTPQART
jgi:hypothetical protein